MEYAISELPFASVSERVLVHNLSYGNEFNLKDNSINAELISIWKVVHQDSF